MLLSIELTPGSLKPATEACISFTISESSPIDDEARFEPSEVLAVISWITSMVSVIRTLSWA